ncbi:MAG: tyramine oxidase, partial [Antricoccus sp.]
MTTLNERISTAAKHPLEPLSEEEITQASTVTKGADQFTGSTRFVYIELAEPAKDVVAEWTAGSEWDRRAACLLRDPKVKTTAEVTVSLSRNEVVSWRFVDGVQPPMMFEEFMACEEAVRNDSRWQDAMRKRGVEDFSLAMIDPWASGYTGPDDDPAKVRLARPLTFMRTSEFDNGYARPVEGLIVTVDLDTMTVIDVADHGVVAFPMMDGNYEPELAFKENNIGGFTQQRAPMKEIRITQPDGPSFEVDGHAISWGPWRCRIGFNPREGLTLHDVGYVDKGTLRPVLYRASLTEMYVPYGDPA